MSAQWPEFALGDVCRVVNGGTPKTGVNDYWGGPHAWITPAEMGGQDHMSTTRRTLTDAGLASCSATLLPPDSVILSSRAPIGHLVINDVPMATNQGCKGLVPGPELLTRFLYFFLAANVEQLNALGTGATFKELSATKLKSVRIPVPPIAEQARIVRILDEALNAIDTAQANTRASIAKSAELAGRILTACFDEVSETAPLRLMSELVDFRNGLNFTRSSGGDHVAIVGVKDFKDRFWAPTEDLDTVQIDGVLAPSDQVKPGDILVVRSNGNPDLVGRCMVVGDVGRATSHSGFTIRLRTQSGVQLLPEYLAWYLRSPSVRRRLTREGTGTNIKSLSQRVLAGVGVPVPPLVEQNRVVESLTQGAALATALSSTADQKKQSLSELREAVLIRALAKGTW